MIVWTLFAVIVLATAIVVALAVALKRVAKRVAELETGCNLLTRTQAESELKASRFRRDLADTHVRSIEALLPFLRPELEFPEVRAIAVFYAKDMLETTQSDQELIVALRSEVTEVSDAALLRLLTDGKHDVIRLFVVDLCDRYTYKNGHIAKCRDTSPLSDAEYERLIDQLTEALMRRRETATAKKLLTTAVAVECQPDRTIFGIPGHYEETDEEVDFCSKSWKRKKVWVEPSPDQYIPGRCSIRVDWEQLWSGPSDAGSGLTKVCS